METARRSMLHSGSASHLVHRGNFEDEFRIGKPVQIGNYLLLQRIGKGGSGRVFKALNVETGDMVAIKSLSKAELVNTEDIEKKYGETFILAGMQHKNIVQLYQVFDTLTDILLVMELAPDGDLRDYLGENRAISEFEAFKYFEQLADAAKYCHKRKTFHGDLKPSNVVLFPGGVIKIVDFGLSGSLKTDPRRRSTAVPLGTPLYLSPEQASGVIPASHAAKVAIDVWGLGVILFCMVCGFPMFSEDLDRATLTRRIQRRIFRIPSYVSPNCRLFLERILDANPATRLRIENFEEQPWWIDMKAAVQAVEAARAVHAQAARSGAATSLETKSSSEGGVVASDDGVPSAQGESGEAAPAVPDWMSIVPPQYTRVPTTEEIIQAKLECYSATTPLENSAPTLGSQALTTAGANLTTIAGGTASLTSAQSNATATNLTGALAGVGPGGLASALSNPGRAGGSNLTTRTGLDVASRYADNWSATKTSNLTSSAISSVRPSGGIAGSALGGAISSAGNTSGAGTSSNTSGGALHESSTSRRAATTTSPGKAAGSVSGGVTSRTSASSTTSLSRPSGAHNKPTTSSQRTTNSSFSSTRSGGVARR